MDKDKYSVTSLALAAAIQLASNGKLLGVEKVSDKQSAFVFEKTSDLVQIVEKFYKKDLLLDAFSYFESLRYIKSILYRERGK